MDEEKEILHKYWDDRSVWHMSYMIKSLMDLWSGMYAKTITKNKSVPMSTGTIGIVNNMQRMLLKIWVMGYYKDI